MKERARQGNIKGEALLAICVTGQVYGGVDDG